MNIYDITDPDKGDEKFVTLHQTPDFKIEAIRSRLTHPGEFYNQQENEWVILVRGEAQLEVEGRIHTLTAGDSLYIPRHTPHQVLMSSDDALWIAVFSS